MHDQVGSVIEALRMTRLSSSYMDAVQDTAQEDPVRSRSPSYPRACAGSKPDGSMGLVGLEACTRHSYPRA